MPNIIKKDKEYLNEITELTPESLEKINNIFRRGVSIRQIYSNLTDAVKKDPQIIELCIKNINQSSLKTTLELISETTGLSEDEFLKMANKYHPGLVASYAINYKLETERLIELMLDSKESAEEMVKKIFYNKEYTQEEKNKIYGYSPTWMMDGKPVQYIKLLPNIEFKGREDYMKLVNNYLTEDSSTIKFCNKYFIDKKEFNSVLDILSREDKELGEQIDAIKERASQKYMGLMKDLVEKVTNGETTIEELIDLGNGRIDGWDFLGSLSFTSEEQHLKLLQQMVKEINADYRTDKRDKLDKKYNLPQIGGFSLEKLGKWFDMGKGQPVEDITKALKIINGRLFYKPKDKIDKNQKRISYVLTEVIKSYRGDVSMSQMNHIYFENPETKERKDFTKKNLQDALTILKANKKIPSHELTILLLKDIVYGKVPEEEINEAYRTVKNKELQKKGKIEKRQKSMSNLKNIDEYITYINSPQVEQENKKEVYAKE